METTFRDEERRGGNEAVRVDEESLRRTARIPSADMIGDSFQNCFCYFFQIPESGSERGGPSSGSEDYGTAYIQ